MKKLIFTIFIVSITGLAGSIAQTQYASFQGPSHFMRIDNTGTDFITIDNNDAKGSYTFFHSYLDIQNPWSVVSEEGTNIYTKLNLKYSSDFKDLFLISPEIQLTTEGIYTFSQRVFGIANETIEPGAIAKLELQMLEGKPEDFKPDMLAGKTSLGMSVLREFTEAEFTVENIVPGSNGSHYFVIYVTYLGYFPGNTTAMSVGFKQNRIVNTFGTAIKEVATEDISIFPNPALNVITVQGIGKQFKIINSLGQSVMTRTNYEGELLDVSDLQSGVYLVQGKKGFSRFVKH